MAVRAMHIIHVFHLFLFNNLIHQPMKILTFRENQVSLFPCTMRAVICQVSCCDCHGARRQVTVK